MSDSANSTKSCSFALQPVPQMPQSCLLLVPKARSHPHQPSGCTHHRQTMLRRQGPVTATNSQCHSRTKYATMASSMFPMLQKMLVRIPDKVRCSMSTHSIPARGRQRSAGTHRAPPGRGLRGFKQGQSEVTSLVFSSRKAPLFGRHLAHLKRSSTVLNPWQSCKQLE